MNLTVFDKSKYLESLRKLEHRKAPEYVVKAYKEGYISVVNRYYKAKLSTKLESKLKKPLIQESKTKLDFKKLAESSEHGFIKEALSSSDIDFLKAFFIMTNADIVTGKKLPPNASKLLKQEIVRDLGLKDLYKKLR